MIEVEPSPSVRRAKEMLEDPHRYFAEARARAAQLTRAERAAQRRAATEQPAERVIYGVHAVRPREVCATRFLTADLAAAEAYARALSQDPGGVLAAAVTSYVLDCECREQAQALYVAGRRQNVPHVSEDRRIYAGGHGTAPDWAPK